MRQRITNPRTLRKLSARLGRPVVAALTRGGTNHRVDVLDADGKSWHLWPDGTTDPFPEGASIKPPQERA